VLTVTVKTAAKITGLSRSTILRRVIEGELETVLCHGRRLVNLASLKKLVGATDAP
jgi:excisionase family DNA binding protein